MKREDITQPVIDKCKQIAKHWRMDIYEGTWYLRHSPKKLCLHLGRPWSEIWRKPPAVTVLEVRAVLECAQVVQVFLRDLEGILSQRGNL